MITLPMELNLLEEAQDWSLAWFITNVVLRSSLEKKNWSWRFLAAVHCRWDSCSDRRLTLDLNFHNILHNIKCLGYNHFVPNLSNVKKSLVRCPSSRVLSHVVIIICYQICDCALTTNSSKQNWRFSSNVNGYRVLSLSVASWRSTKQLLFEPNFSLRSLNH